MMDRGNHPIVFDVFAHEKDLNNSIINAAFLLLYKDLIRLFASYNEGMINLIEKYFTLKLKECRLGMDLYHNFPGILDKITEFLTLAEGLGIGDKDSLGLQPVPEKVIHAMEQHLAILESKKGSDNEDDSGVDHRTPSRPAPPKKPNVPVPLPPTKPDELRSQVTDQLADLVAPESEDASHTGTDAQIARGAATINAEEAHDAEGADQHAACPTVVVNDEVSVLSAGNDTVGWLEAVDVYNSGPSGTGGRQAIGDVGNRLVYGVRTFPWAMELLRHPGGGTGSDSQTLSPEPHMRMDCRRSK
ncbi:unnamed protein product [Echinostoma caproni]|uniref:ANTH domain-containing protein n=1 Tax=Echinostoma caproni TaxID=27848 RepID=A0A183AN14_9TREM|nr:unnamed protein product [Echinostoma caproni]